MDGLDNYKPTISINANDLPDVKKWKVGEQYDLIVSVKQTGVHEMENGQVVGEFQIQKVMSADGNDPMDLEDINSIADNGEFMRASAEYRSRNGK